MSNNFNNRENSGMEKFPPELERKINADQIKYMSKQAEDVLYAGSPEQRIFHMKMRLLKRLNEKEYVASQQQKRKSRFA